MKTYHGSCHCGRVTFRVDVSTAVYEVVPFDGRHWEDAVEALNRKLETNG